MKKILVIDDEKEILAILEKALLRANYEVRCASSGQEALNVARDFFPDVILLDIAMPDIDGYSLAAELYSIRQVRNAPIIFMTGQELDVEAIEKRALGLGAYDYILKPCGIRELLEKIKKALG